MFAVTSDPAPTLETALPALQCLLDDLDEPSTDVRALHLLALAAPDGVDEPLTLDRDPLMPTRVAAAVTAVAARAGGRVFTVSDTTYAIVNDAGNEDTAIEVDVRVAFERLAPSLARRFLYGRVDVPRNSGHGHDALGQAFDALRSRVAWRPQSPARQVADVLVQLLAERNLAGRGEQRARVAAHAVATGRALGLDAPELHEIVRAAELQDVGLLTLPEAVLRRRGPLTPGEWRVVRHHPVAGERIVSAATALSGVARLVRSCYERYDGSGYPDGLVGEEIPLGARIIAVCVAYEAMVSGRPYRPARSREAALSELDAWSGRQFDPCVVAAFRAVDGGT